MSLLQTHIWNLECERALELTHKLWETREWTRVRSYISDGLLE